MTDDQRSDSLGFMPTVMDRLAADGIRFDESFVTTPLCGPSRASFLTGQYAHRTGVRVNDATLFDPSSTLATWLQQAGYTTALVGKYLNGYYQIAPTVPPGWDSWHALVFEGYYNYQVSENGERVWYGNAAEDYSTDVMRERALEFIEDNADRPFFLYLTPYAPHNKVVGAPRHEGAHADFGPWRPESFNEEDISDKFSWIFTRRFYARIGGPEAMAARIEAKDQENVRHLDSLLAVDEAVEAILDALVRLGLDDETIVIYTSDNGEMWGEHWLAGKLVPYEEAIRVPLVIRYPPLTGRRRPAHPRVSGALALNIDLAPTLAELAGVERPDGVDGRSLGGLLCGTQRRVRGSFLVENFERSLADGLGGYGGVRTAQWKYVLYDDESPAGGALEELYHLSADPLELDNLIRTAPDNALYRHIADLLRRRMERLQSE